MKPSENTLTGAQILMTILQEEGVDTLFGFPGGAVIDIYDELARTPIQHILVRHNRARFTLRTAMHGQAEKWGSAW